MDTFFNNKLVLWKLDSERLSKNNRKIAGRSGAGSSLFNQSIQKLSKNKSILSVLQNYEGEHNSLINKIANFSIFSPSTPILRGVASDNSFQEPLGIYGGGLAKALANLLEDKNKKRNELQRFFYLLDWFQSVGITEQINTDIAPEQSILGNILVTYKDKFMKTNKIYNAPSLTSYAYRLLKSVFINLSL